MSTLKRKTNSGWEYIGGSSGDISSQVETYLEEHTDEVPIADSDNLVKSGGVFGALSSLLSGISGAINDVLDRMSIVKTINGVGPDASGNMTLNYEDVGALPSSTTIPQAVTESTVSGWGFTKNGGTYSKPSSGIPSTDLASDVQASLEKADNSVQQVSGKGLSTNDYTTSEKNKLSGIESGATRVLDWTVENWGFAHKPDIVKIFLDADDWEGTESPYIMTCDNFPYHNDDPQEYFPDWDTKIDLIADETTLQQLMDEGVTCLLAKNEDEGSTYVFYAFGAKPSTDLTLFASLTKVEGSWIFGGDEEGETA